MFSKKILKSFKKENEQQQKNILNKPNSWVFTETGKLFTESFYNISCITMKTTSF